MNGYEIYELFVEGDNTVQGRIAFRIDGYVDFTAKNKLIEHYKEVLGAQVLNGQRMYIDEVTAHELIGRPLTDKETEQFRVK